MLLTWTAQDLEVCTDLNLPCADVAGMLAEPLLFHSGCCAALLCHALPIIACMPVSRVPCPARPVPLHREPVNRLHLPAGEGEAQGAPSFNAVSWLKPAIVLRALQQGYAVMMAGGPRRRCLPLLNRAGGAVRV